LQFLHFFGHERHVGTKSQNTRGIGLTFSGEIVLTFSTAFVAAFRNALNSGDVSSRNSNPSLRGQLFLIPSRHSPSEGFTRAELFTHKNIIGGWFTFLFMV
jgi:hypothetical protein